MAKSVGHEEPLSGADFTVNEMWRMSQRSNQVWGLKDYEVPVIYYDTAQMKLDKDLYRQATGKDKKKPPGKLNMAAKRVGAFGAEEKHALACPAPWHYNVS